jgi:hypothetical protein
MARISVTNPLGSTYTVRLSNAITQEADAVASGSGGFNFNAGATGSAVVSYLVQYWQIVMTNSESRISVAFRVMVICSTMLFMTTSLCEAMSRESSGSAIEAWGRAFCADMNGVDPLYSAELYLVAMSQDGAPPQVFLSFEDGWCGGPPFVCQDGDVMSRDGTNL